jgi:small subunit ribosomal protein S2
MKKVPGAVFIIDPKKEKIAISEAKKLGLTVIAMVDTNCDPDQIDCAIPANDDAVRSIRLILDGITSAYSDGKSEYAAKKDAEAAERAQAEAERKAAEKAAREAKEAVKEAAKKAESAKNGSAPQTKKQGTADKS